MRVTYPSTSAQYFHLLRNQARHEKARPLIVLTPKSLLRAEVARSRKEDLHRGAFNVLMEDPVPVKNPDKLILCSGKVFYDLMAYRREHTIRDTYIVRLEQFYPFPFDQVGDILKRFPRLTDIRWVQEEPRNMGGWNFVLARMQEIISKTHRLKFIGRLPSASPATGSYQLHLAEQALLLKQAFTSHL
jgi:2-oxoglutarate dehydrogenase E1 component